MERVKSVTLRVFLSNLTFKTFSQCGVSLYLHKRNDNEQENLSF